MRVDKRKPCPFKSHSDSPLVSFMASSNHNPLHDPAPSFSHITPTTHVPSISHNTSASHTYSIHHKESYSSSVINPSASGVRSSSYCSSCSVRSDTLTCPIIPGCISIIDICKGHSNLGLTIVGGCNTLLVRNIEFRGLLIFFPNIWFHQVNEQKVFYV